MSHSNPFNNCMLNAGLYNAHCIIYNMHTVLYTVIKWCSNLYTLHTGPIQQPGNYFERCVPMHKQCNISKCSAQTNAKTKTIKLFQQRSCHRECCVSMQKQSALQSAIYKNAVYRPMQPNATNNNATNTTNTKTMQPMQKQ